MIIFIRFLICRILGAVRFYIRKFSRKQHRVLLLRNSTDHLGDMVLAARTLETYRRRFPNSWIEFGCPAPYVDLFTDCPYIDLVVPLNCFWDRCRTPYPSLLNAGRFDLVVFLRRTPNAVDHVLVDSFRPCRMAVFAGDDLSFCGEKDSAAWRRAKFDIKVYKPQEPAVVHELTMQKMMLEALGAIAVKEEEMRACWLDPDAPSPLLRQWLKPFDSELPIIVCAPCGSDPMRSWEPSKYRKLFDRFSSCVVVLVGTAKDSYFGSLIELSSLDHVHVVNLIGQTTISELFEVVNDSDGVVTAENGVYHICEAINKPSVCIAGGGHWKRFCPYPYDSVSAVLTNRLPCFGCNWHCIRDDVDCIKKVSVDDVYTVLNEKVYDQHKRAAE